MKQNVYLLSGLLCDATVWAPLIPGLEQVAEVCPVDFRGFDDISAMAEHVLESASDHFALVGHSMGARVALEVCRRAPERVERLALLSTGIHPAKPGEQEARQRLIDLAHSEGMAALADRWLPPMMMEASRENPVLMQPLLDMVHRMTPTIYEQQVNALLNRPDAGPQLEDIRCPVLVGVGRQDQWSPLSQHELIASRITNSRLVVFDNSGHMAPFEAAEQVLTALINWLK